MTDGQVTHADLVGMREDIAVLKEQIREIKDDAIERRRDFKEDMLSIKDDMVSIKASLTNLQRTADMQTGKSIAVKGIFGAGLAGLGAGAIKIIELFTTQ